MILFMKDSGLSISDVCNFSLDDYRKATTRRNSIEEQFVVFNPINRIKTGTIGYRILGPRLFLL